MERCWDKFIKLWIYQREFGKLVIFCVISDGSVLLARPVDGKSMASRILDVAIQNVTF